MNHNFCPNCQTLYTPSAKFCPACGKWLPLPPASVLQARYQIEKLLGQGGFGAVYVARDLRLKRECVVKQMTLEPGASAEEISETQLNFEREAQALVSLNKPGHPSIPEIYDFFTEADGYYLVMKLIGGENLEERLNKADQPLPINEVVSVGIQIASALEYMHTRQEDGQPAPVLHRDLKPGNILVDEHQRAWLVDFGLSKVQNTGAKTRKTTALGTPGYAPSEQYGGLAEPRSDVYALAATLYHLLTNDDPGEHPFAFPQLAQLPAPLQAALQPALAQMVSARLTATEFRRFLEKSLAPVVQESPSPGLVSAHVTTSSGKMSGDQERTALKSTLTTGAVHQSLFPLKRLAFPTSWPQWLKPAGIVALLSVIVVVGLTNLSSTALPKTYFTSDRTGNMEIYRLASTGKIEQVTHSPGDSESWGTELTAGGTLYFTSTRDGKREIYRLSSAGGIERVTHSPGRGESWGAEVTVGGMLYFTSTRDGKREIYRIISSGEIERVTHSPNESESWHPVLSLGGTLYFTSTRDGKREIYRIIQEGTIERVTHTPGHGESWDAEVTVGGTLYFTSTRDGKREIYRISSTNSIERVTHTPGYYESWASQMESGGGLLFTSTRDGKREVYRLTKDGVIQRITSTPVNRESWTIAEQE